LPASLVGDLVELERTIELLKLRERKRKETAKKVRLLQRARSTIQPAERQRNDRRAVAASTRAKRYKLIELALRALPAVEVCRLYASKRATVTRTTSGPTSVNNGREHIQRAEGNRLDLLDHLIGAGEQCWRHNQPDEAARAGRTRWSGAFNPFDHHSVKLSWATMEVNHC